jgi:hypothetical protein
LQGEEKRRRNSSKGRGEKKNKTDKQKPKYRKENLQNAEKALGFREGFFFPVGMF